MNKDDLNESEMISMLKESGLEKPTKEFSNRLSHLIVQSYKANPVIVYGTEKWLGKLILSVLVSFNLVFLYYLDPFSVQPAFFISASAFVLGSWGVIGLIKKSQASIS